jgi:hypothetical protein
MDILLNVIFFLMVIYIGLMAWMFMPMEMDNTIRNFFKSK